MLSSTEVEGLYHRFGETESALVGRAGRGRILFGAGRARSAGRRRGDPAAGRASAE